MSIPIQNIFYLLCYAWNKLDHKDIVNVEKIDTTELIDLFAHVLTRTTARLLKQGLDRYYVEKEEMIPSIKGKFLLNQSLKRNTFIKAKTVCNFDEFSPNILHNQILKTTLRNLLRVKILDKDIHNELRKIYIQFPPVDIIEMKSSHFKNLHLHRNNSHYDFLMNICRIIHENIFIDETDGMMKFEDFIRDDKKMANLFESFVRNFYMLETDYFVLAKHIKWQLQPLSECAEKTLPIMRTDITLESLNRKIIIDTKYYKNALKKNSTHESSVKKLCSDNLYQIFAYLINQENGDDLTMNCDGILLYPTVEHHFKHCYTYRRHNISAMTINLNQPWQNIRHDLLEIIE